jgi:predicted ribosome quality control (RQC) complex YloA/Tae2 family protein
MKTRYSGLDLACQINELQSMVGMRINRIYDIDKKTYLIKFQRTEEKAILLIESGSRIHSTNSVWPKSDAPSGFTMKLRKHLKNKRLEEIYQLGADRVAVLQFGINEVAHYLILELYDRGNIVLTDHEFVILGVLRPRIGDEKNTVIVRETYDGLVNKEQITADAALKKELSNEEVTNLIDKAGPTDNLKKILVPQCSYGPALLEHLLLQNHGLAINTKKRDLKDDIVPILGQVLKDANAFLETNAAKGYITQKIEHVSTGELRTNVEFHPFAFKQHEKCDAIKEFDTFNASVDEFFSQLESQKIDMKTAQHEKQAFKKLENIKKDHDARLEQLEQDQNKDRIYGEYIEMNGKLVDKALTIIRSAIGMYQLM